MKDKCVFAGSFDPVHLGHLDIIGKCNMMFEKVVVAIGVNDKKKYTYSLETRLEMLKRACAKYDNVVVTHFDGYLADYMTELNAEYYVRGIRNQADEDYETANFKINSERNPSIQTIFLPCSKEVSSVSSTRVKENLKNGKSVEKLVPREIIDLL